jgi:hypothetical protein
MKKNNKQLFIKLCQMRMPFGKYKNTLLLDLPEHYIIWFKSKGFPKGQLGDMLNIVYEIKLNGLEYLFRHRYIQKIKNS